MKRPHWLYLAVFLLPPLHAAMAHAQTGAPSWTGKIVEMEVYVPEGRWVQISSLEGERAVVEDKDLGLRLALVPSRTGEGVRVDVFQVERAEKADVLGSLVQSLRAEVGGAAFLDRSKGVPLGIRIVGLVDPVDLSNPTTSAKTGCLTDKRRTSATGEQSPQLKYSYRCCVTCGGTTSCGCAVDDSCGSCCSGPCCGPPKV